MSLRRAIADEGHASGGAVFSIAICIIAAVLVVGIVVGAFGSAR